MIITGVEESHLKPAALSLADILLLALARKSTTGKVGLEHAASYANGLSVTMTAGSTKELQLYSLHLLHGTVRSIHNLNI